MNISHKLIGDAMTHYTQNCPEIFAASPVEPTRGSFVQTLRQWLQQQRLRARIQRERAYLRSMPDSLLRDIGIDRATAEHEAERRDIPAGRNC
jgi:uncharacterized protein YjiS (DUF1127 family)